MFGLATTKFLVDRAADKQAERHEGKNGKEKDSDRKKPYLFWQKTCCPRFPASSHQNVIQSFYCDLFVIIVLGCHGELAILALNNLDRREVWIQLDALTFELSLSVFCRFWVKTCKQQKIFADLIGGKSCLT